MNKQDYKENNEREWGNYFNNKISSNELEKRLGDNYEEYNKYGY